MWPLFLLLIIIGILLAILIFILLTEGRYLGKQLVRWSYNRRSMAFEVRNDWKLWEHIIKRLGINQAEELLDLGTQTGHLPRLVARKRDFKGHVVGIDWSEEMIIEARRQVELEGTSSHVNFLCRDVQNSLPFSDDTFTVVTCVTGLINGLKKPEALFKEIQRVLKIDGRVAFRFEPHPLRPTSIRSTSWFTSRLEPLGFSQTDTIPWTQSYKILVFRLKQKK